MSHLSRSSEALTRRRVLQTAPAAALLLSATGRIGQASSVPSGPGPAQQAPSLPVLTQPDLAFAFVGDAVAERHALTRAGELWTGSGSAAAVALRFIPAANQAGVALSALNIPIQRLYLRWKVRLSEDLLALGDAWERSYGDLAWRPLQPERPLPWYALVHAAAGSPSSSTPGLTSGMGVKTGAAAFCFWQLDPSGISLWLDVRNGGNGVLLGTRTLEAATLVTCTGEPGESAFALAQRLCWAMAQGTAVPAQRGGMRAHAIYGSNDWYYSYGHNTPDGILRDADLVASLSPSGPVRPFTVIDDGYQDPVRFPSLPRLASAIRSRGVTPGLWIRPLRASSSTPAKLLLPNARLGGTANREPLPAYDPTLPEAMERIAAVADDACRQGFDLIKHDFTTYELFGQWGSQMGASPTQGSWHFYDRSLTNAEVVTLLYRRLRLACGPDRLILGCNTVGHLSVGLFDASRTGDDVSGRLWERTRRTGVNTLAFRLPQHRAFFALDADCVPITPDVPWSLTRQWLNAIAGTGTVLLISPDPRSIRASTGQDEKEAIRAAFARCLQAADDGFDSSDTSATEPLDWLTTRTPSTWAAANRKQEQYAWLPEDGAPPFPIGIQRGPA